MNDYRLTIMTNPGLFSGFRFQVEELRNGRLLPGFIPPEWRDESLESLLARTEIKCPFLFRKAELQKGKDGVYVTMNGKRLADSMANVQAGLATIRTHRATSRRYVIEVVNGTDGYFVWDMERGLPYAWRETPWELYEMPLPDARDAVEWFRECRPIPQTAWTMGKYPTLVDQNYFFCRRKRIVPWRLSDLAKAAFDGEMRRESETFIRRPV